MKTPKLYLIILLSITSCSLQAGSSYSGDSLSKLYLEMQYLQAVGEEIHQRYDDLTQRQQIKDCNFEYGQNATRARGLIGQINRMDLPDKDALINAGWAAYSCSSCKETGDACTSLTSALEKIKAFAESDPIE